MQPQNQPRPVPDREGYFGEYGGRYVPDLLIKILEEITRAYYEAKADPAYREELADLYRHYVGRPSPVFYARNLSRKMGGAQIYLK
ncbi:MAG: tryptophan synthase subunit beta, partial [Candidatus Zixiibacteriota bacterium]